MRSPSRSTDGPRMRCPSQLSQERSQTTSARPAIVPAYRLPVVGIARMSARRHLLEDKHSPRPLPFRVQPADFRREGLKAATPGRVGRELNAQVVFRAPLLRQVAADVGRASTDHSVDASDASEVEGDRADALDAASEGAGSNHELLRDVGRREEGYLRVPSHRQRHDWYPSYESGGHRIDLNAASMEASRHFDCALTCRRRERKVLVVALRRGRVAGKTCGACRGGRMP